MDEILSDHIIAAPVDPVTLPEHTEKLPEFGTEPNDIEYGVTDIGIVPAPVLSADAQRSIIEGAPGLSQHMQYAGTFREPIESARSDQPAVADVLHVGCGTYHSERLHLMFRQPGWREIRLDIDPQVGPDVIASITDMQIISDAAFDAVYSSHNVEHLYPHEVPLALHEMNRVLKSDGFAFIKLPDLQEVARFVAGGRLEDPLYLSPMGAIAPLDILYGHRPSLAQGNTFMAHRTGFTGATLGSALIAAGFAAVMVQRDLPAFSLTAIAFRSRPNAEQIARWQARLLPAEDRPTVLYTLND